MIDEGLQCLPPQAEAGVAEPGFDLHHQGELRMQKGISRRGSKRKIQAANKCSWHGSGPSPDASKVPLPVPARPSRWRMDLHNSERLTPQSLSPFSKSLKISLILNFLLQLNATPLLLSLTLSNISFNISLFVIRSLMPEYIHPSASLPYSPSPSHPPKHI